MTSHPDILVRGGDGAELARTVLISALVHAGAITLLLTVPGRFVPASPPMASYTVELVTTDQLGGTNLPDARGRTRAKIAAAPVVVAARPASPVKEVETAEAKAAPAPKQPPPAPAVRARGPKPAAKAAPATKQPPAPAVKAKAPQPAAKPKPEVALAARKPAKSVKPPPATSGKVTKQERPEPKPVSPPGGSASAARAEEPQTAARAGAEDSTTVEARKRDQAILAAVQRRAQAVSRGGGAGESDGPGQGQGPMSVGPGAGAGGAVRGVEYLLYYNHMMRSIKESWVWARAVGSLEAVVGFRITPGGDIVEVHTVRSSGDVTYDLSVERAVRGASPLGPPPEQYRSEFENGVEITFRAEDLRS